MTLCFIFVLWQPVLVSQMERYKHDVVLMTGTGVNNEQQTRFLWPPPTRSTDLV